VAALLAWIGAERLMPLDEARFASALARLAARGSAGCAVERRPGFALAVLHSGIPSEHSAGQQPRVVIHAGAELIGALDGWLIEPEALQRSLGLPLEAQRDGLSLWLGAFCRQGGTGLARVRGHYAGLIFDAQRHELWLQRDPGGAKALYARIDAQGCWLSTDESAVCDPGTSLDAALDPVSLARYFAVQAPLPGQGWFRDVLALRAGEQCITDGRQLHLRQRLELPAIAVAQQDAQAVEQFAALLRQAVVRSVSGIAEPIGLSLSSGLDSQTVAAQLHAMQRPFVAHSWLLPDHPRSDESAGIQALVEAYGAPWQHFDGSCAAPLQTQAGWSRPQVQGELFANLYRELKQRLYQQVSSAGCRLLLNGDSGDHLYGDPSDVLLHSLRAHRYLDFARELFWRVRQQGLRVHRDRALRRLLAHGMRRPAKLLLSPDLTCAARELLQATAVSEFSDARQRLLIGSYTTRAVAGEAVFSEALGLEIRSPMRDPDLLGFALQMRPALARRAGVAKWIAREALRGVLPEACRMRQKSGDLSFFLRARLRGTLLDHWRWVLSGSGLPARWPEFVEAESIARTLADPAAASEPALVRLWLCVALEHWRQTCAVHAQVPSMEAYLPRARHERPLTDH
jgi:asparagine synthase (glutamine-hydrolysing)